MSPQGKKLLVLWGLAPQTLYANHK